MCGLVENWRLVKLYNSTRYQSTIETLNIESYLYQYFSIVGLWLDLECELFHSCTCQ